MSGCRWQVGITWAEMPKRLELLLIQRALQLTLTEEAQARKGESTAHPASVFEEGAQPSTPAGMPQFFERFDLDLTNPLTTQVETPADFLQGVHSFAADAESHAQDLFFTRGERAEDAAIQTWCLR
jgi:hypothetical protein